VRHDERSETALIGVRARLNSVSRASGLMFPQRRLRREAKANGEDRPPPRRSCCARSRQVSSARAEAKTPRNMRPNSRSASRNGARKDRRTWSYGPGAERKPKPPPRSPNTHATLKLTATAPWSAKPRVLIQVPSRLALAQHRSAPRTITSTMVIVLDLRNIWSRLGNLDRHGRTRLGFRAIDFYGW
jgi:hypothetical protein